MSWAPDLAEQHREAARYVDKILKGANPGDLPIRYPARYFLRPQQHGGRQLQSKNVPRYNVVVDHASVTPWRIRTG